MGRYTRGRNWSAKCGTYRNGRGTRIVKPTAYFRSVGSNRHGYNSSYSNGYGTKVNKPRAYYRAVGEDRYGYNGGGCRFSRRKKE